MTEALKEKSESVYENENFEETKESILTLSLDVGASISKAVYTLDSVESSQIYYMYMDAEMIVVPEQMLQSFEFDWNLVDAPEHSAWIKSRSKALEVFTFGLLARKLKAQKQIHLIKYENAVEKSLAFIGAIAQKHNLSQKLTINLNLLIPYNEFESRVILEESIKKAVKSFYFRKTSIKGKLTQFFCLPEGYGGFLNRVNLKGYDWLKNSKLAVIMIGHRNCSCLVFERGTLNNAATIDLGFIDLIEEIKKHSIGQKLEDLEEVIPLIGLNTEKINKLLPALLRSQNKSNQEIEFEKLKITIINSRQKVWTSIKSWLDGQIPSMLHETIVLGGAAQYFCQEIEEFLKWTDIHWAKDTANEINNVLFSEIDDSQNMPLRFIDVYGLHKHIIKHDRK
ncbi:hypothetical protein [Myxosarcina sp. GI1]|uniref:hypothetical protein n=1 Tax=Myxosarcina sp. GI1 TaxID=1541065 RepID=UPI00056B7E21|nr:hypothetical protein [Myxosarcina sp. GI1]